MVGCICKIGPGYGDNVDASNTWLSTEFSFPIGSAYHIATVVAPNFHSRTFCDFHNYMVITKILFTKILCFSCRHNS